VSKSMRELIPSPPLILVADEGSERLTYERDSVNKSMRELILSLSRKYRRNFRDV